MKRLVILALFPGGCADFDWTGGCWSKWTPALALERFGREGGLIWASRKVVDRKPKVAVVAYVRADYNNVSCGFSYGEAPEAHFKDGVLESVQFSVSPDTRIQWLETFGRLPEGLPQAFANCRKAVERKVGLE